MGFTPTGGLMMGTRSGDLDPGVLVHLLVHEGYDAAALERLVDHESGLLGVSGVTSDMKVLLETRATQPHAAEAVELFCYVLRKHIGALVAVLAGRARAGSANAPRRCARTRAAGSRISASRSTTCGTRVTTPSSARRGAPARCGSCRPTRT